MKRMAFTWMITLSVILLFASCNAKQEQAITEPATTETVTETDTTKGLGEKEGDKSQKEYYAILEEEYISAEDVVEKLGNDLIEDSDISALRKEASDLAECGGRFVQTSEDNARVYTADVAFYYEKGSARCSVEYTNYLGDIADNSVEKSTREGFLFETKTDGAFYSRTHEFTFYFSPEFLCIVWDSGTEYTLTRGDGSAEGAMEHKEMLDESDLYTTLKDKVRSLYSEIDLQMTFVRKTRSVFIFLQTPKETQNGIKLNEETIYNSWEQVKSSTKNMSQKLHEALIIGNYADHVYMCWVDKLNENNEYKLNECSLMVDNGEIVYERKNESSSEYEEPETQNDDHIPTVGEKNALERAYSYLKYTAFSYSGLVEQLEYEGYSESEANYAADHCGADWYEQAALKARAYLKYSSFSRSQLKDQLLYEGFSESEAEYGVNREYR